MTLQMLALLGSAQVANKFTIYPQSTSTAPSSPTTASTDSSLPCIGHYFESAVDSNVKVAAMMTANRDASTMLTLFTTDGTVVTTVTFSTGADVLVFKDPLKVLIGRNTVSYLLYTLQCTWPACVLNTPAPPNNTPVANTINYVRQVAEGSSSSYIILGGTNFQRYDIYFGFMSSPTATFPDLGYSCIALYLINNNNYIVQTNERTSIPILSRDTFAIVKTLAISRSAVYGSQVNNLRDQDYYHAGPGYVDCMDVLSSNSQTTPYVTKTLSLSYNALQKTRLINFGSLNFLGMLTDANLLVIMYKGNLTIAADPSLNALGTDVAALRSFTGTQMGTSLAYVYYTAATNKNFQSYGILMERCLNRDISGVCSQCYTGHYRSSSRAGNLCLLPTEFPPKYGINSVSRLMSPCLAQGCYLCVNDYTVCTQCDHESGYYLFGGVCTLITTVPDGYGLDKATLMVDLCADANCNLCQLDRANCTSCIRITKTYLKDGGCQTLETLPLGFGVENATYTAQPCSDENCDFCRYDFTFCETCQDNEPPFVLYDGKCYEAKKLPAGIGQDTTDYTGKECSTTYCVDCSLNFENCTACNRTEKNLGVMENTCVYCDPKQIMATVGNDCVKICENPSCMLLLVGSRYNYHKTTATIKFSKSIAIESLSKLKAQLTDPWTGNNLTLKNGVNMTMTMERDSLIITLAINQARYMGSLIVEPVVKDDTPLKTDEANQDVPKPFLFFPISVDSIFGYTSTGTRVFNSLSQISYEATRFVRTIASFFLVPIGTTVAVLPAQLSSAVLYMKLVNGQAMMYPTMMFEYYVGDPQVPFVEFDNPFTDFTTSSNCTLPPRFFERELGCNILSNFGVGTLIIYATLAINIAISSANYVMYTVRINVHKTRNDMEKVDSIKATKGYKVLTWFTRYYGIRFFRIRLEGITIELLIYSMINVLSEFEQTALTFGAVLSYLYLGYYIVSNIYTYMVVREVYPKLKEKQDVLKTANEAYVFPPTETVASVVNLSELKYGAYDLFFHEYTANINPSLVYTPFINLARTCGLVLVLFCFSRAGIIQVVSVLAIELAYIVFLFKSNFRTNRYEHYLILMTQLGYIFYAFLSLLTYLPTDENTKQVYIGFSMAATLIAVTYVTLIYVFSIFVYRVIYQPLQLLYYKLYMKNLLANRKLEQQQDKVKVVWDGRGMPEVEEEKKVTVQDLLKKRKEEDKKNEQRAIYKSIHHLPEGEEEETNLKNSSVSPSNLNKIHPFVSKPTAGSNGVSAGEKPAEQKDDDNEDVRSEKGSVKSTQFTAPHKISIKNRMKKAVLRPTMPDGEKKEAKPEAKGVFTFDRMKKV